jgi:negative regulator of sigma-B (phosphoserine phosphatase)
LAIKTNNRPAAVDWGVAARPLPGAAVSGDLHLVKPFPGGILAAVIDGLGQGTQAALAARTAAAILAKYASHPVASLVKRCHGSLMMTRGAVMTLVSLDLRARSVSWLGVGNVEGVLLRGDAAAIPASEHLRLHGGLVGYQLPKLEPRRLPLRAGDLLALATDGISGDFTSILRRHEHEPPAELAERILESHFKGNDDALVLVLRYLGSPHE